jgi:Subtilase family/Right handed beta helix region/Putative metal-binding motif
MQRLIFDEQSIFLKLILLVFLLSLTIMSCGGGGGDDSDDDSGDSSPKVLTVPGQYSTIQAAINAATDGDTVRVGGSHYIDNTLSFMGKEITVTSETGVIAPDGSTSATVIFSEWLASGDPPGFVFENGENELSRLIGFYIKGDDTIPIAIISSSPTIENCIISSNFGVGITGANPTSTPLIINNCRFEGDNINRDINSGSNGLSISNGASVKIDNCIFEKHGEAILVGNASIELINSDISLNAWGLFATDNSNVTIRNSTFYHNVVEGIYVHDSNLNIKNCVFNNWLPDIGTGIGIRVANFNTENKAVIDSCKILNNYESGIYINRNDAEIKNCLIKNNPRKNPESSWVDGRGANIRCNGSSPNIINCTIVNDFERIDLDRSEGGIWAASNAHPNMRNSILWGNIPKQFYILSDSSLTTTYSNIQGGYPGEGNINEDPQFVDAENDDYRLKWGSDCIDALDEESTPGTDIEGNVRPQGLACDMGAYEGNSKALIYPGFNKSIVAGDPEVVETLIFNEMTLEVIKNELIVSFEQNISESQIDSFTLLLDELNCIAVGIISNMQMLLIKIPDSTTYSEIIDILYSAQGVKHVLPNVTFTLEITPEPNVPNIGLWNSEFDWFEQINAYESWVFIDNLNNLLEEDERLPIGSEIIGIVDSGYYSSPEEKGTLNEFEIHKKLKIYDRSNNEINSTLSTSIKDVEAEWWNGLTPDEKTEWTGLYHGSNVAAIACGDGNPKNEIKTDSIGIAWESPLIFVELTTRVNANNELTYEYPLIGTDGKPINGSDPFRLSAGIEVAIDNGCKIINISQGKDAGISGGDVPLRQLGYWCLEDAVIRAAENDCLLVFSGGNEGQVVDHYYEVPTDIANEKYKFWRSNTMFVGGIDNTNSLWENSAGITGKGKIIDILGVAFQVQQLDDSALFPGEFVDTLLKSGTSFSAPQVTGAAALIKTVNKNLLPKQIKDIIIGTSQKISGGYGVDLRDDVGLLNVGAAVKRAVFYEVDYEGQLQTPEPYNENDYIVPFMWKSIEFSNDYAFRKIIGNITSEINSDNLYIRNEDNGYLSTEFYNYNVTTTADLTIQVKAKNTELGIEGDWSEPYSVTLQGIPNTIYTWYRDSDEDGFGNEDISTQAATKPSGYVSNNTDCDDSNQNVYPGANEICGNARDDNCDNQIDEGCPTIVDNDNDGYNSDVDCNDSNPNVYPGAAEVCGDAIDNDCDDQIDENCSGDSVTLIFQDYSGNPLEGVRVWVDDQGGSCDFDVYGTTNSEGSITFENACSWNTYDTIYRYKEDYERWDSFAVQELPTVVYVFWDVY